MDLHEEYYNRRALKSPLIKRPKEKSSLLLRRIDNSNKKQFFYILSECVYITTEGGQRPPSFMHYIRGINKPVPLSGFSGQGVFGCNIDEKRIEWDAYEPYMYELCNSLNSSFLKGYMPIKKEDVLFHQWNIMVYFYGEVFSKYADIDAIAETFDDSREPKERIDLINKVVAQTLKFIDSSYCCHDNWSFLKNTNQFYDDWLANLIIGKIKSN